MTATAPTGPQSTGAPLTTTITIVIESLARHRREVAAEGLPTWFLVAMTLTAVAAGTAAWVVHSLALMLLALLYAVTAFAVDAVAAVRIRLAREEAGE